MREIAGYFDKKIQCHAAGDRCLGCMHYRGIADKCAYATDVPNCASCDAKTEQWWSYCAMCGYHIASGSLVPSRIPQGTAHD